MFTKRLYTYNLYTNISPTLLDYMEHDLFTRDSHTNYHGRI